MIYHHFTQNMEGKHKILIHFQTHTHCPNSLRSKIQAEISFFAVNNNLGFTVFLLLCRALMLPESPRWLVDMDREDEAVR